MPKSVIEISSLNEILSFKKKKKFELDQNTFTWALIDSCLTAIKLNAAAAI